MFNFFLF